MPKPEEVNELIRDVVARAGLEHAPLGESGVLTVRERDGEGVNRFTLLSISSRQIQETSVLVF